MGSRPPPRFVVRQHDDTAHRRKLYWLAGGWAASLLATGLIVAALAGHNAPAVVDKRQVKALTAQNDDLKQQLANLQRAQQVNDIATKSVRSTLAEREEEINGLRADLGFYSRLIGGDAQRQGLRVQELKIVPVSGSPTAWNINLSLTQSAKRGDEVTGKLQVSVDGLRGEKVVQLDWPALGDAAQKDGLPFRFKYFQQLHATFVLPADFKPTRLHVKVMPNGDTAISRAVGWNDALAGNLTAVQGDKDAQP
ncbi:DUF6776 family protein [Dyella sp.]|uniref:DUF6776 family protein n=1 Tax=Dyella sp. TaxID=1869338 RepID=UPI002ED5272F